MEISKQVCSLELAQKLKELGVKQESYFHWKHNTESPEGPIDQWVLVDYGGSFFSKSYYHVSAFSVAELGEMLPNNTTVVKNADRYFPQNFRLGITRPDLHHLDDDTEADVRAKMLIYLIENKLITI